MVTNQANNRQILIVGDTTERAPYHPLDDAMKHALGQVFSPLGFLTFTTDLEAFDYLDPTSTDICISFVDRWEYELSERALKSIEHFMREGNLLLVLHHGLSYQSTETFARMVGAKFITHPEMQDIQFTWEVGHPLGMQQKEFSLYEEPYQLDMFDDDKQIFLWYEMDEERYPAGWSKNFGKGSMVYMMPGHDTRTFVHSGYKNVLQKIVQTWCESHKKVHSGR